MENGNDFAQIVVPTMNASFSTEGCKDGWEFNYTESDTIVVEVLEKKEENTGILVTE